MANLAYDAVGWVHVIASFCSMVFGAWVILGKKGTQRHKQLGYGFALSMVVVLVTAMMIYRLFRGFGIFHVIALIGFVYLALGILPAFFRIKNWLRWHIYFMYWSVIGLYAAFAAEISVRLPEAPFWWAVGLATALIAALGGVFYGKYKQSWHGILASESA